MRYLLDGMYDRSAKHGPITGSGPNFKSAMRMFNERQANLNSTGTWRKGTGVDQGKFVDPDWYVVSW